MDNKLKFVNENHKKNYIELLEKFTGVINREIDIVLRLLSIDEVYNIAKEYIAGVCINFNGILNDSRIKNTTLFISELAYSFYQKSFEVKDISSTRKLDADTRNFIIDVLYLYTPKTSMA